MHDDHKGNESSSIKLTYYIWWDNYVEADEISYDKAHNYMQIKYRCTLLTSIISFYEMNLKSTVVTSYSASLPVMCNPKDH